MESNLAYLRDMYEAALAELTTAREEYVQIQRTLADAEQRVRSLESLLALEGEVPENSTNGSGADSEDFIESVERILADVGRPLRISELRDVLLEEGLPLPGKGTDTNFIAKFQRSDGRIVRVARGEYDIPRGDSIALFFAGDRRVDLRSENTLGRSTGNDIIINDRTVSAEHARITIADSGQISIEDLGSKAGTRVNGDIIAAPLVMQSGDDITLGNTTFTIRQA